jgi:hypothetical protein
MPGRRPVELAVKSRWQAPTRSGCGKFAARRDGTTTRGGQRMVDQLEPLKNLATTLVAEAKDASTTEKAVQILKAISDIEKQSAEAGKLQTEREKLQADIAESQKPKRSEERKQLIAALVPVPSTLILGGTLILQSYQAYNSEGDKRTEAQQQRLAAEDLRWQEALKGLSTSQEISTTALYIKMFLNTERYGPLAKQTAFQLLANTNDTIIFKNIFDSLYVPATWKISRKLPI